MTNESITVSRSDLALLLSTYPSDEEGQFAGKLTEARQRLAMAIVPDPAADTEPPLSAAIRSHLDEAAASGLDAMRAHLDVAHGWVRFSVEYDNMSVLDAVHRSLAHPHGERQERADESGLLDRMESVMDRLQDIAGKLASGRYGSLPGTASEWPGLEAGMGRIVDLIREYADFPAESRLREEITQVYRAGLISGSTQAPAGPWRSDKAVLMRADPAQQVFPSQPAGLAMVKRSDPVACLQTARYMIRLAAQLAEQYADDPGPGPVHLHTHITHPDFLPARVDLTRSDSYRVELPPDQPHYKPPFGSPFAMGGIVSPPRDDSGLVVTPLRSVDLHAVGEPVRYYHPDTGHWLDGKFFGWQRPGELALVAPAGGDSKEATVIRAANLRWEGEADVIWDGEEEGGGAPGSASAGDGPQEPDPEGS